MQIRIIYDDSRIEVFRTDELTDPKAMGAGNLLTNYEVRLDGLGDGCIWLETYYYEASPAYRQEADAGEVPVAHRKVGWRFLLVDRAEIGHVEEVWLDSSLLSWREGGQLVFGSLFAKQERLYYSDRGHASLSRRAVFLHDYLARRNPDLAADDAELCAAIGYPKDAYDAMVSHEVREIRKAAKAQQKGADNEGD